MNLLFSLSGELGNVVNFKWYHVVTLIINNAMAKLSLSKELVVEDFDTHAGEHEDGEHNHQVMAHVLGMAPRPMYVPAGNFKFSTFPDSNRDTEESG